MKSKIYDGYDSLSERERLLAKKSSQTLASLLEKDGEKDFKILAEQHLEKKVHVPVEAVRILVEILSEMAQGNEFALLPLHTELNTQQAADYLNVSNIYLNQLLNEGKIPFQKVGSYYKIRLDALRKYKRQVDSERLETLTELSKQAQELNLGY